MNIEHSDATYFRAKDNRVWLSSHSQTRTQRVVRENHRVEGALVFGVPRRHMKTIGYPGRVDEIVGLPAIIGARNIILSVVRTLKPRAVQNVSRSW